MSYTPTTRFCIAAPQHNLTHIHLAKFTYNPVSPRLSKTPQSCHPSRPYKSLGRIENISNRGSSSSGASTVSGITTPTAITGEGDESKNNKRGSFYAYLTPDPALVQLVASDLKIQDLIGTVPPPQLDGPQVCLSYLVRQGCWSMCGRAHTHGKTLNAAERARVINYLRTQVQRVRPSAAATGSGTPGSSS
jgi:hypothetical protein